MSCAVAWPKAVAVARNPTVNGRLINVVVSAFLSALFLIILMKETPYYLHWKQDDYVVENITYKKLFVQGLKYYGKLYVYGRGLD